MIRINRYHIASAFVLPSLLAGYHGATSPCGTTAASPQPDSDRGHLVRLSPCALAQARADAKPAPERRALERDGTFWRWEFGARDARATAWSGGLKVALTTSPSPELASRHEPFADAARRLGFHPDVPMLTGHASTERVAWTFMPRETLQRVAALGQGRVRAAHAVDAHNTYVVYYGPDGTGADLYALDSREGAPIWRVSFGPAGVGSADAAQLVVRDGDVHLYTMSADQRWSVRVDPATGEVVGKRRLAPEVGQISRASLRGMTPAAGASEWFAPDGSGGATLRATFDPAHPWTLTMAASRFGGVHFQDDTLFALTYEPSEPGAILTAIEASTGEVRWVTRAHGLGGVYRGEVENDVALYAHGDHLVVHGQESRGEYVEALDMRTGETVMSKRYGR